MDNTNTTRETLIADTLAKTPKYAGGTFMYWLEDAQSINDPNAHHELSFGNWNKAGAMLLIDASRNAAAAHILREALEQFMAARLRNPVTGNKSGWNITPGLLKAEENGEAALRAAEELGVGL